MALAKLARIPEVEEGVKGALRRFKREGQPLDPNNPQHCAAYAACRLGMHRVSPEKVLQYLEDAKHGEEHGASCSQRMWAVPRENFPHGVPFTLSLIHI